MQDNLSDKLPIFVFAGTNCKSIVLGLMVMALAGCASVSGPTVSDDAAAATAETADAESMDGLDADLLFHVLAAERLIAVGEFEEALGHLIDAARLSDDPQMARQAVGMAMRSEQWLALVDAALLWQQMEPEEDAGAQFVALGRINLGAVEEASADLARLIETADDAAEAWRDVAALLAAVDQAEDANRTLAMLVQRLDLDDNALEVLESRSFLAWQQGDLELALALATEAAASDHSVDRLVWAAQLAVAAEDPEAALALYGQAAALDPDDVNLALSQAEVLRQLDRIDEAVIVLSGRAPETEGLYALGTYQFQAEDLDGAADTWTRLAAIETPDEPSRHAFLTGFLAELLEKDDQALAWYEQVGEGSYATRAKLRRAVIKAQRREVVQARSLFQAVREADRGQLGEQAYLVEADLLRELDQAAEAVRLLTRALREQPSSVALLYTRAIAAVAMDDLDLAEQDFRRILQIDEDNAMALNALGYTLTDRTNRHQEAYRLIRRALELEPDSPAIQDSMGWVYFRLGQPERALPYLEQALMGENNPEIAAHLGEVLLALGREEEAVAVFRAALQSFPDDRYLNDTLARLGIRP
ncbi:MAG: tetratricopeptide repeat protein [Wenzhouxiangella sp.]